MGRNANGLLKSNTDKGALTVGQLGLHPKAIKMFENPISGWLWEYLRLSANSVILGRYKEACCIKAGLLLILSKAMRCNVPSVFLDIKLSNT